MVAKTLPNGSSTPAVTGTAVAHVSLTGGQASSRHGRVFRCATIALRDVVETERSALDDLAQQGSESGDERQQQLQSDTAAMKKRLDGLANGGLMIAAVAAGAVAAAAWVVAGL